MKLSSLIILGAFFWSFCGSSIAAEYKEKTWLIEGLPEEIGHIESVTLPANPDAAARIAVYKLENFGYPLAKAKAVGNRLIISFGIISTVNVESIDGSVRELVRNYLKSFIGNTPKTIDLDRAITFINDISGFSGSLSMRPLGDGRYELVAKGQMRRQFGVFSVRNTPGDDLRTKQASIHQEFYSGITAGDILKLDATGIDGNEDQKAVSFQISHGLPIGIDGYFLETQASYFDSSKDSKLEAGQSNDTRATTGAIILGKAFSRNVDIANYVYSEIDYRAERATGFDPADYAVFRTAFVETHHFEDSENFTWGVGVSGGKQVSGGDPAYGILRGGFGFLFWLPSLFETAELKLENSWQIGSSNIPGYELFSFSGVNRQRGFAPYEYAGNHGADLIVELAGTFSPWGSGGPALSPRVFLDFTYLANAGSVVSSGRPKSNKLLGSGVGTRISFQNGFSLTGGIASPIYDHFQNDRGRNPLFYVQGQFSW